MTEWALSQLTFGSAEGVFHAHSYYDIPVFDGGGSRILAHRMTFEGRQPRPADVIGIEIVHADAPGSQRPLGESSAWSWQQGPMAQWIAGGPRVVWNDREGSRAVGRLYNTATGDRRTLPAPVYATDPAGRFALCLNMARLDALRPGYGYPGCDGARLDEQHPKDDGVWRLDLATGEARLALPLDEAVRFFKARLGWRARLRHAARRFVYWFNHAKISPDGQRFTVKLRWRATGGPWNESMGVSLTCGCDGDDLRLLADATSHVIWLDSARLYFWREDGVVLYEDASPFGRLLGRIAPGLITENVHIRHFPDDSETFVFDTPYRETIDLILHHARSGTDQRLTTFGNHRPARGPFRCDLHPCPSPDGRRIAVTSLQDGGRQLYVLTRQT